MRLTYCGGVYGGQGLIYISLSSESWFIYLGAHIFSLTLVLIHKCLVRVDMILQKNLRCGRLFKPPLFLHVEVFSLLDFRFILLSWFYSDHEYYSTVIFLSTNKLAKLIVGGLAFSIIVLIGQFRTIYSTCFLE